MNRRKTITLFLSITIHLLILSLLWYLLRDAERKMLSASSAKRVEISLQDFITPPPSRPKTVPVRKTTPPAPRPKKAPSTPEKAAKPAKPVKPTKPVQPVKKRPLEPKTSATPATDSETKRKRRSETSSKSAPPKKRPVRKTEAPKSSQPPTEPPSSKPPAPKPEPASLSPLSKLAGALGAPAMPVQPPAPSIDQVANALSDREFKALYKDDFDRFSPEQKKFIKDNLSRIQGITQHYLTLRGYPYTAVRLGQQGMNIVEFDLHPNGDITGLKVIKGSESETLDKNSLDTIKTAYKDYPRPKETTKIRFYIYYRLY
ncbi:TonB family protein [Hydrogenimonas sp.]